MTLASCSGIKSEHRKDTPFSKVSPYISFEYDDNKSTIIKNIADKMNIVYEEGQCYFKRSYCLRLKYNNNSRKQTESEIVSLWNEFRKEIDKI